LSNTTTHHNASHYYAYVSTLAFS